MKVVKICFLVLWMALIFSFSNQKDVDSSKVSDGFIDRTVVKIYKIFNENITKEKENEIIEKYTYPIRKFAHYTLYFILGILSFLVVKDYSINKKLIIYSLLICFLYACSDEFHQLFIIGRSARVLDVMIDTFGSLCGISIKKYLKSLYRLFSFSTKCKPELIIIEKHIFYVYNNYSILMYIGKRRVLWKKLI